MHRRHFDRKISQFIIILGGFCVLSCKGYVHTSLQSTSIFASGERIRSLEKSSLVRFPYLHYKNVPSIAMFSPIFLDDQDDDELIWDVEDDDEYDDDDKFDVKFESSIYEEDSEIRQKKIQNRDDIQARVAVPVGMADDVDDTDDSYYEQLFLQQSRLSLNKGKGASGQQRTIRAKGLQESKQTFQKNVGNVDQQIPNSRLTYKEVVSLRKDWKEKIRQMRNEAVATRKNARQGQKHLQMEERSSLLALKALRLQSMMQHEQLSSKKGVKPIDAIPISTTKNYKEMKDKMNNPIIRLEQKMYGKRFKTAQKVYFRLLEVLEAMTVEAKRKASEMIANRLQEQVAMDSMEHLTDSNHDKKNESHDTNSIFLENVTKMNARQKLRMHRIAYLSLNGGEVERLTLSDIDTEDLRAILRIRGNIKRRGRMPKERNKVIEQLEESFASPLF